MTHDDPPATDDARMAEDAGRPAPFTFFPGRRANLPVVISVPHAGRDYDQRLLARARLSREMMRLIEDRHADALVAPLVAAGHAALIARTPRAAIDLNRDARDIDTRLVRDVPHGLPLIASAKQRGGLGLFPRALPGAGELWRAPMAWAEAKRLLDTVHGPYHALLDKMLEAGQRSCGCALLLDIHSMPPLPADPAGLPPPDMVIGDRFGASADGRFSALAQAVAQAHGLRVALNHPYPGSYVLERHGRPERGRHALQIEVSRALYLDSGLDMIGDGLGAVQAMLVAMVDALIAAAAALGKPDWPLAAE